MLRRGSSWTTEYGGQTAEKGRTRRLGEAVDQFHGPRVRSARLGHGQIRVHDKMALLIDGKLYASGGSVKGQIYLPFRPSPFVPNVANDALIGNGKRPLGQQEQVVGTLVWGA